jgi:tetratricopeptide (TPR) repeat protein
METPPPRPSPFAAEVARIRELVRAQRAAEARTAAVDLLAREPAQREGLLFKAVAERLLGHTDEALATLAVLERHYPQFAPLHEERGLCYASLRQGASAIAAFRAAVDLNHALPGSWSMLEAVYRASGDAANAAHAGRQAAALRKMSPEVIAARAQFSDRDLDAAEATIRPYLQRQPGDAEAMRLLARIGIAREAYDDAELLLGALVERAPRYRAARLEYAEVLIELQKWQQATTQLERLLQEDPANRPLYRRLLATAAAGLGNHEQAIALYRGALDGTDADADVHLSMAHALRALGRGAEAVAACRQAIAMRPGFGEAYWSLANLKTYRFTADELAQMRAWEANPETPALARYHLCFALGKALEDLGDHAGSFRHYALGNELKHAEGRYRPEAIEANARLQAEVCDADFFARLGRCGAPDADPIFIVGLPRSGSTLVEQILASHSQVEGTHELPDVQRIVAGLRGRDTDPLNPRYPGVLEQLTAGEFRRLGEKYLADTRIYRHGRPRFIDKMPNNFRHLGLIHQMLPNATVIDVRREPMACCFSNFRQLYGRGQEFTYGFEDLARYYRSYLELMGHWDRVLPGWVLRVRYEDLVGDLEGGVRRILAFCKLDYEPACLDFHRTPRSVRTASSEQVRQPIYRESLEQWRSYEPWLAPLESALGDALHRWRE